VRSFLGGQATTMLRLGERLRVTPRLRIAGARVHQHRQVNASFLASRRAFTVSGARRRATRDRGAASTWARPQRASSRSSTATSPRRTAMRLGRLALQL